MTNVMPNWLEKRAELSPERTAVIVDDKSWTFQELHNDTLKMVYRLAGAGVRKSDHVGLLIQNTYEAVTIIHALEYMGAVGVLLNIRLTASELAWQLADAKASIFIFDPSFKERVADISDSYQDVEVLSITDLEKMREVVVPYLSEFELEATHSIIYTSGTTGKPKGVMLSYGNHWWSAVGSALNLGLDMKDSWLCCLPIFHVGGLSILMRSTFYGISVILHEGFDEEKINRDIQEKNVTIISVVSAMLSRMLQNTGEKQYPDSLRCVLLGGGPAPKPILEECKNRNIPVYQTYGMTETASQIVTLSAEYMLSKIGSAGKALYPAQLKIVEKSVQKKANEVGEIMVKGPNVAKGYFNREDATQEAIKNDWLHTGDLGYLDEDGFLYVVDRRSDLIISGGENVYPAEIEAVLLAHEAVLEAGVTGVEDADWGKVPAAFLVTNREVHKEEMIEFLKKSLAKYKVPKHIYFVEELPRNATNKLLRRKLIELLN